MDSISDLLGKRQHKKPDEIDIIQQYTKEHFDEKVSLTLSERTIIIGVASAPFAATLRHHLPALTALTGTKRKLVIRIL